MLGAVTVPRHPASQQQGDRLRVSLLAKDVPPRVQVGPAAIAELAVPLFVAAVAAGIERESELYRATYSGRGSTPVVLGGIYELEVVRCRRGSAHQGGECAAADRLIEFRADVDVARGPALRIVPTAFVVRGTEAKVASSLLGPPLKSPVSYLNPFYWLTSIALLPWQWTEGDLNELDVNLQVGVEVVVRRKQGGTTVARLGSVDFPFEGVELPAAGDARAKPRPEELASPYLPLPIDASQTAGGGVAHEVYANLVVTVQEAGDLGDVIARGAQQVDERERAFSDTLLEVLGLRE